VSVDLRLFERVALLLSSLREDERREREREREIGRSPADPEASSSIEGGKLTPCVEGPRPIASDNIIGLYPGESFKRQVWSSDSPAVSFTSKRSSSSNLSLSLSLSLSRARGNCPGRIGRPVGAGDGNNSVISLTATGWGEGSDNEIDYQRRPSQSGAGIDANAIIRFIIISCGSIAAGLGRISRV